MSGKFLPTRTLLYVSVSTCFLALPFSWGYQPHSEYCTVQDLPPNGIICFLEFYKELMHGFVVFSFFPEY